MARGTRPITNIASQAEPKNKEKGMWNRVNNKRKQFITNGAKTNSKK